MLRIVGITLTFIFSTFAHAADTQDRLNQCVATSADEGSNFGLNYQVCFLATKKGSVEVYMVHLPSGRVFKLPDSAYTPRIVEFEDTKLLVYPKRVNRKTMCTSYLVEADGSLSLVRQGVCAK